MRRSAWRLSLLGAVVMAALTSAPALAAAPAQEVPVDGKVTVDNACFVRLPDLGRGLYGGHGAYNPATGVLVGGAEKRTDDNTIVYHDLYALKLDGTMSSWNKVPYANGGYLRQTDRGCREMASVPLSGMSSWLSVLGKDGCDGSSGARGDIKELQIGATANAAGVRWRPNVGISGAVPSTLEAGKERLLRLFAVWDGQRNRLVFGQGTFDDEKDTATQDKVYEGVAAGTKWNVRELRPGGGTPVRRFGACGAYIYDPDTGLDGALVLGGQQGGTVGTTTYKEVWWLDFARNRQGEWNQITPRFTNMDDFGGRREGACAFDPATKTFYSWFGRARAARCGRQCPGQPRDCAGLDDPV